MAHARKSIMPILRLLCILLSLYSLPAFAAEWATLAHAKGRVFEIDRSSILNADNGAKVAWGRVVLSDAETGAAGYTALRALNRYDCRQQSFSTVKRIYDDADGVEIREEKIDAPVSVPIKPGSMDDRFYQEVCRPVSLEQLRDIATSAQRNAASAGSVKSGSAPKQ
jgi:carbonic anhydrase